MDTDRNLLFGVLALQADLIDARQFAEACAAWAASKDGPLADLLVGRGWLQPADREDVERLLCRKLQKHGGDARASLVASASNDALRALAVLGDPDLMHTFDASPRGGEGDGAPVSEVGSVPRSRERYALNYLHARGGIGQVWQAHDGELGRDVALKELLPGRADDKELRARFLAEAQITAQLDHPSIVPVYELVRPRDGDPFYTMPFVRGRTLTEAARDFHQRRQEGRDRPGELHELLQAFVSVCNALSYAHVRGVIHRDLKGPNVLLGPFGEVLVLDWGMAKVAGAPETTQGATPNVLPVAPGGRSDEQDTLPGQLLGTPAYMSPEQALGRVDLIDPRTDVFGLGAILYEVLTGRPPVGGADLVAVLCEASEGKMVPVRQAARWVPKPLEAVCHKALAKRREDRYQTAKELAEEVKRWLAGAPVEAWVEPWSVKARRWVGRNKALAAATVAAAVMALFVGGGAWGWTERDRAARAVEQGRLVQERNGKATAELERAAALRAQARGGAPDRARGLTAEALAAAQRADGLLAEEGSDEGLRERARALVAEVREEERDRRMAVRLLEARTSRAAALKSIAVRRPEGRTSRAARKAIDGNAHLSYGIDLGLDFDRVASAREYARAFAEDGIDPWARGVKEGARKIRARAIRLELIAALDDWAMNLQGGPEPQHLLALAQAADDDPVRHKVRDALAKNDWKALEKQARSEQIVRLPASTLVLLGDALAQKKLLNEAESVLRQAQYRYPDDLLVNLSLADVLIQQKPSKAREVIRFASAAVALRKESPGGYLLLAAALSVEGRPDEAVPVLRKAIELAPKHATAHHNLGYVLYRKGDHDEAIAAYRRAIALKPDYASAHNNLGDALKDKGRLDDALVAYRKAVALAPENAFFHNDLGSALRRKGAHDEAIAAHRKSIALKPDHALAHSCLGDVLKDKDRLDEALVAYRKAVELGPENAFYHNDLGLALSTKGQYDEALRHLHRAIELSPRSAVHHNTLGYVLNRKGDHDEAIAAYRRAIALKPDYASAHNNLGDAFRDKGRLDEALVAYRKAVALSLENAVYHNDLGWALTKKGRYAEALRHLHRAIELGPKNASYRHNLAYALDLKGSLDDALAAYRKAIELGPKNAAAHNNLGLLLNKKKRHDDAIDAYRKAIALKPDYASAHNNLGDAFRDKGRLDDAIVAYRKGVALSLETAVYHNDLGWALNRKGRYDEALRHLHRAIELSPKSAIYRNSLGDALKGKGRLDDAIAAYRKAIELGPETAVYHSDLGLTLASKDRYDEALRHLHRAVELSPRSAGYHNALGYVLNNVGRFDQAIPLLRKAIQLDPKNAAAHSNLGWALNEHGQFDEALPLLRKAIALWPEVAPPRLHLGTALVQKGQFPEALASLRRAHELFKATDTRRKACADQMLRAERLVKLDGQFPAILRGEFGPAEDEWALVADLCHCKRHPTAAARLWKQAFTARPTLAEDLPAGHRCAAARAAALAGCGRGEDAAKLSAKERELWRRQAIAWLRADLILWTKELQGNRPQARAAVQQALRRWQRSPDLAGLREEGALAKLPEGEQAACCKLWAEVGAVLARSGGGG